MGYYVTMTASNLRVPLRHEFVAVDTLKRLNWRNELKHGGCYRPGAEPIPAGPHPDIWFSWMPWNYHELYDRLQPLLECVGFFVQSEDGYLEIVGYDDKTGCENVFLQALAPFFDRTSGEPSSEWSGEDNRAWRVTYADHGMEVQQAYQVWGDPETIPYFQQDI